MHRYISLSIIFEVLFLMLKTIRTHVHRLGMHAYVPRLLVLACVFVFVSENGEILNKRRSGIDRRIWVRSAEERDVRLLTEMFCGRRCS